MALHRFHTTATVSIAVFLTVMSLSKSNVIRENVNSEMVPECCGSLFDVCCTKEGRMAESNKTCSFRDDKEKGKLIVGKCVPYYLCHDELDVIDDFGLFDEHLITRCCVTKSEKPILTPAAEHPGCGFRNADGIGSNLTETPENESRFGELPWTAAILITESKDYEEKSFAYQCGGSLIHPSVVLTAAHRINGKEPNTIKVRLGEWDVKNK